MLYIQAISPIRVGAGQGVGSIDLPVIREVVTGWPYLPGSGIKGVLRDACREARATQDEIVRVFGTDPGEQRVQDTGPTGGPQSRAGGATPDDEMKPGNVIFADLRLLALPVRTYIGGFAWVTSPLAIHRWQRDHTVNDLKPPYPHIVAGPTAASVIQLTENSAIVEKPGKQPQNARGKENSQCVWLEDLKLKVVAEAESSAAAELPDHAGETTGRQATELAEAIAEAIFPGKETGDPTDWQAFFVAHFGIVSNTTFGFLARTAMEVTARNKLEDSRKVVATGALWWEEAAPAETIFAGPLIATPAGIRNAQRDAGPEDETDGTGAGAAGLIDGASVLFEIVERGSKRTLQIGANATVGRGLATASLWTTTGTGNGDQP